MHTTLTSIRAPVSLLQRVVTKASSVCHLTSYIQFFPQLHRHFSFFYHQNNFYLLLNIIIQSWCVLFFHCLALLYCCLFFLFCRKFCLTLQFSPPHLCCTLSPAFASNKSHYYYRILFILLSLYKSFTTFVLVASTDVQKFILLKAILVFPWYMY